MRILVVEDEADLNLLLCKVLTKAGYTVDGCLDGEDAQAHLLGAAYDGILLDVMLPKKDGYTLVQELRDQGNDTPVLFLSAPDSLPPLGVQGQVPHGKPVGALAHPLAGHGPDTGQQLGKVKGFDQIVVPAQVQSLDPVGHTVPGGEKEYRGVVPLDTERRQAVRGGEEIPLLPKEFSILEYLVRNKEKVLSREQIEDQIWNYDYAGSSKTWMSTSAACGKRSTGGGRKN